MTTITVQIPDAMYAELGRVLIQTDRTCSEIAGTSFMLGLPIIKEHPEPIDRQDGYSEQEEE